MAVGYIFLSIALTAGLAKGFCGKKISGGVESFRDSVSVNLIRMFFCGMIGLAVVGMKDFSVLVIDVRTFSVCLMSAVSMTAFGVCWMLAYRCEAYMYLNIFTMLGTIVTCFLSLVIFDEPIRPNQWAGMAILLISVYMMTLYNNKLTGKMTFMEIAILVIGALGSAAADFSQKVYTKTVGGDPSVFNFYTYFFSLMLLLLIIGFTKKPEGGSDQKGGYRYILICFVMSACLYINSLSKTFAAQYLTTAQMYPVMQGLNLILSALMAQLFFRERVNAKCIVGMSCAFVGLIIMNLF